MKHLDARGLEWGLCEVWRSICQQTGRIVPLADVSALADEPATTANMPYLARRLRIVHLERERAELYRELEGHGEQGWVPQRLDAIRAELNRLGAVE